MRTGPAKACSLLAALLLSGAARADARSQAKRHFRQGMQLIAADQIERGIAELKRAYAIKPHPFVLYDIAKAYIDLGNIPEALNYFRRYVASDPSDKDQVTKVMARLQAAIAAQASPPPASAAENAGVVQKMLKELQALPVQQQAEVARAALAKIAEKKAALAAGGSARGASASDEEMFEPETITASTRATAKEIAGELSPDAKKSSEEMFEEQVITPGR